MLRRIYYRSIKFLRNHIYLKPLKHLCICNTFLQRGKLLYCICFTSSYSVFQNLLLLFSNFFNQFRIFSQKLSKYCFSIYKYFLLHISNYFFFQIVTILSNSFQLLFFNVHGYIMLRLKMYSYWGNNNKLHLIYLLNTLNEYQSFIKKNSTSLFSYQHAPTAQKAYYITTCTNNTQMSNLMSSTAATIYKHKLQ